MVSILCTVTHTHTMIGDISCFAVQPLYSLPTSRFAGRSGAPKVAVEERGGFGTAGDMGAKRRRGGAADFRTLERVERGAHFLFSCFIFSGDVSSIGRSIVDVFMCSQVLVGRVNSHRLFPMDQLSPHGALQHPPLQICRYSTCRDPMGRIHTHHLGKQLS